ncbi:MAG: hypothetical protein FWE80_01130 [Oscillospiraceae bacterium]|nr:hypothetical protein [Oscillospiraceae bacterium]
MAETLAQEQAKTKPELEDFIAVSLHDYARQAVLAFLDYCRAKKISYRWTSTNTWTLKAKGKSLGGISIDGENCWAVWLHLTELLQYDDFIVKENLQSAILNSIKHCTGCNSYCAPGYTGKILGKEHRSLCRAMYIVDRNDHCIDFTNPDAAAIDRAKRIIDFRLSLPHGTASRPVFDPVTDGLTRIDNTLRVSGVSDLQGNPFRGAPNMKIDYLFDGKYTSYARFWANENCYDVVFQLDEPVELVMYSLVTGFQLQVPDSWKLYGAASKDGPWMLLDARDEFPKPVTGYTEKTFKIGTPGAYRCYRFTFERCKFDLSQVHLYTRNGTNTL